MKRHRIPSPPKKPKAKLPPLPAIRKAKGFYFRHYFGGEFDGVREQVPIFAQSTLRQSIDKPHWSGTTLIQRNVYELGEVATKPAIGKVYPYLAK